MKRNWKKAGARRLRVGAAIAIFAMTACADDSASDQAARESETAGTAVASASPFRQSTVEIAALAGIPPTEANLFSEMLKEEAERASVPLGGKNLSFDMTGAMGAGENEDGTYVVAVVDIEDGSRRIHRIVNEMTLPDRGNAGAAWDAVGNDELRRFAAATAGKIASWYSDAVAKPGGTMAGAPASAGNGIVTGSIADAAPRPTTRPPFDISVGPAPGDGNISLARALNGALIRRIATATWLGDRRYRIEGNVVAASRNDGKTDVSIRWLVKSIDGRTLGEVLQQNALDAESIAARWDKVAETAAEAAADGVLAVLEGSGRPAAANS